MLARQLRDFQECASLTVGSGRHDLKNDSAFRGNKFSVCPPFQVETGPVRPPQQGYDVIREAGANQGGPGSARILSSDHLDILFRQLAMKRSTKRTRYFYCSLCPADPKPKLDGDENTKFRKSRSSFVDSFAALLAPLWSRLRLCTKVRPRPPVHSPTIFCGHNFPRNKIESGAPKLGRQFKIINQGATEVPGYRRQTDRANCQLLPTRYLHTTYFPHIQFYSRGAHFYNSG